jgi:hypothetical protein
MPDISTQRTCSRENPKSSLVEQLAEGCARSCESEEYESLPFWESVNTSASSSRDPIAEFDGTALRLG